MMTFGLQNLTATIPYQQVLLFDIWHISGCTSTYIYIFYRPVCEALLSSSYLVYNNRDIWCSVFSLVRRIIGGVDYKVVTIKM